MAVKTSWFVTEQALGANLNLTYAGIAAVPASVLSSGNIDQSFQLVASDTLGTTREASDGSQWILVKASTTVTQFNLIAFDDNYNANNATSALMLAGQNLAVAQFQTYLGTAQTTADPAANPVFWAMVRGTGAQINVSGSAGTGVAINNAVNPGSISVSTTGTGVGGITLLASAGASGAVECNVYFPRAKGIA